MSFIDYYKILEIDRLDINLEGIEVINRLLGQISTLQKEVNALKNRLHSYETL